MLRLLLIFTLLGLSACQYTGELRAFTTDGCSAFPDGPSSEPDKWRSCCLAHDKAYWLGGTCEEREKADEDLRTCIAKVQNEELAAVMWAGVRAGGSPYFPTPFRWSYGWPYTRGYRAVTPEERKLAEKLLREAEQAEASD